MGTIAQLIDKIQSTDARRQELRVRLLEQDTGAHGAYDAELLVLNRTIEGYARRLNDTLATYARSGTSPGKVRLGRVIDPELKAFLEQVRQTCQQLDKQYPLGGKPRSGSTDAAQVARDQREAARLRRDIGKRQRELNEELSKTGRAEDELVRERQRLEQERKKVERQRDQLLEQRDKVQRDLDQAQARKNKAGGEQAKHEKEKTQLVRQLRSQSDGTRRRRLEQQIGKLNEGIRRAKHAQEYEDKGLDRARRMLDSMDKRELAHFEQALGRLDEELTRLEDEATRLEERKQQIAEALEVEERRLTEIEQAEASLNKATSA